MLHWEAAFPSLFDPSVELNYRNFHAAKEVARVLMAMGESDQANQLIEKALPLAKSLLRGPGYFEIPRVFEATLRSIEGDEREALDAIRRSWGGRWSPYELLLIDELKPILDHPEYQAMAAKRKAELAVQLERIREMEANGELARIPVLEGE